MQRPNDILWKGVLEPVFEEMLRFVFPDVDAELDLQRGVVFLEKELGEMYPEPHKATSTRSIRDYPDDLLINNDNPFALVMLVAKSVLLSGQDLDNKLLEQKILIFNLLHERGLMEDPKINRIFVFLNNYILFKKKEINLIFTQHVDQLTGKKNTVDILEQLAEIKAEESLKKGLQQGRQEGAEKAHRLFVENLLKDGKYPLAKIATLANVSLGFVKKVKASLLIK